MIRIEFRTTHYTPDRHTIGVKTSVDNFGIELPLQFDEVTKVWFIETPGNAHDGGFSFKFILNGEWQEGPNNLDVPAGAGRTHTFSDAVVARPVTAGPLPELGQLQRRYFPPRIPKFTPDVIVIGSGMGGGTIADELADLGANVLVLEAGGLVFPTHIANLPRRQSLGAFDKHLWQLWPDFKAVAYERIDNGYGGGAGFNLGGRSVFWGGFIPRMTSWELDFWPRTLKWELEDVYYDKAESLMGKSTAPDTLYSRLLHGLLRKEFPEYAHKDAPMAVRTRAEGSNWIAAGLFSTADLLFESALTPGRSGNLGLEILLNHDVVRIEPRADQVTVFARDLLTMERKEFRAPRVILAAGSIESAKIAARSKLTDPSQLIGRGITDHPVYFTHFAIPATSPHYDPFGNVKVLSQPREGETRDRDPFNVLLELGADFNHGRYLDPEILDAHLAGRRTTMLCEVVFLCNQLLDDENRVSFPTRGRDQIAMRRGELTAPVMGRIMEVRDRLLQRLEGVVLRTPNGNESAGFGGLGGVAHEVGTLRMRVQDNARGTTAAGVVDEDGRWLGHDRLFVCDLSVFPTSPAANPSLTLVALALRLAEKLARN